MVQKKRYTTKSFDNPALYNQSLFETENFKVIPSLGSMVEGWILIIPKRHYISLGQLNDNSLYEELSALTIYVAEILKKEYGEYVIFEHGAIEKETIIGCGVDYAHLHIVPVSLDLISETKNFLNYEFNWTEIGNLEFTNFYYRQHIPYLYYQTSNRKSYITTDQNIPSQLFRKVIATHLSIYEKFDWKKHVFINNIQATIERLSKYQVKNIDMPSIISLV